MDLAHWVDGRPADAVPLDDRGLAYGDGLFETLRLAAGRLPLLDLHLERLADGAVRLGLAVDVPAVRHELAAFVAAVRQQGHAEAVIKLMLTRGSSGRGYRSEPGTAPRRILRAFAHAPAVAHAQDGIALYECRTRLARSPVLAGIKHLNRLEQVLARAEWRDGRHAEGLMCDTEGFVVEGTMSNLFVVRDGRLLTPRLDQCGVAGVMRRFLLGEARRQGIAADAVALRRGELAGMQEAFVCNSVIGIWPVCRLGELAWSPGPVTRALQQAVDVLWAGDPA